MNNSQQEKVIITPISNALQKYQFYQQFMNKSQAKKQAFFKKIQFNKKSYYINLNQKPNSFTHKLKTERKQQQIMDDWISIFPHYYKSSSISVRIKKQFLNQQEQKNKPSLARSQFSRSIKALKQYFNFLIKNKKQGQEEKKFVKKIKNPQSFKFKCVKNLKKQKCQLYVSISKKKIVSRFKPINN